MSGSHLLEMSDEFSEKSIINELNELINNERIQPEPELECIHKYFAAAQSNEFLEEEEIFNLICSHGVQLRNDIKFYKQTNNIDRSADENRDNKHQVPVIDVNDFEFQDFSDVRKKLIEMPTEWTILQITKKFSIHDITEKTDCKKIPGIQITKFSCGKDAEKLSPYCVTVDQSSSTVENIFKLLKDLSKLRREYYSKGRTCKKLYEAYYNTNSELMSFVKELELHVLRHWISLFNGKLEDSNLEKQTFKQIKTLISSFLKKENIKVKPGERELNVIYQTVLSAHFLKNKDIFIILKEMLYGPDEKARSVNVSELMLLVEDLKVLNLSKDCALKRAKHYPVILILDNDLENVPWEMITPLLGQPVSRMSSLQLLYSLYKYHKPHIQNGFRTVRIDCVYGLINPGKDLVSCEKKMKDFLKKRIPWADVEIGTPPDPKDLIARIQEYSAYLYCGHGSGTQYLKGKDLKKAYVSGLILLFGCSSNIPRNCGGKTPHQNNTYTYITNGCPCVIGCMQDVGSTDADAACEDMLSNFMPSVQVEGTKTTVSAPKEPNVLKALANAKGVCSKYWSKSAFVARGIPCMTTIGDVARITSNLSE